MDMYCKKETQTHVKKYSPEAKRITKKPRPINRPIDLLIDLLIDPIIDPIIGKRHPR